MTVFGGDIIYAADINALLAREPVEVIKANPTGRGANVTPSNDPELSGIPLAVGNYEIELQLFFTFPNVANGGLRTIWTFTGTWNTPLRACVGPGSAATGGNPGAISDLTSMTYTTAQNALYGLPSASSARTYVNEQAIDVQVTVAGNLALSWAQQTSSANNTNVQPGSTFKIRRKP